MLSSIVSHCVGGGDDRKVTLYSDLPEWVEVNSPLFLRDITREGG